MTEAALLAAIRDDPDDDLPRLAYADWCEEQGDGARAEFIRLQVELSRGVRDRGRSAELLARLRELSARHRRAWLGGRLARWGLDSQFERGFVTSVSLTAPVFLEHGAAVLGRHPISRLRLRDARGQVSRLAGCPYLAGVRFLAVEFANMNDEEAIALAGSRYLARLRALRLSGNRVGGRGVHAISTSPQLAEVADLSLAVNSLGDLPIATLAAVSTLAKLQRLDLSGNGIGPGGGVALAESDRLGSLTTLRLVGNGLGRSGVERLLRSTRLPRLQVLEVTIGDGATELQAEFGARLVCR